nr:methyltransferase domain-containing protein [Kibdelosporangium sp. MJ126-NF4]
MSSFDWGTGSYESLAPQLMPAAHAAVDLADPRPGQHLVDVGCGTGNAALVAAQRPGVRVTGVDPAERLLELAREKAGGLGVDADFVAGDAASIPLPDGGADVVLSVFAVIFAPDPTAAAAEMSRIAAPHGRIVLTAWVPEGVMADGMRTVGEALAKATGGPPGPGFAWHEQGEVQALLGAHGFDVTMAEHSLAFTAPSVDAYWAMAVEDHPFWLMARPLLAEYGVLDEVRDRVMDVLRAGNEDPAAYRITSRFRVLSATR